jgi:hypothetical protein
MLFGQSFDLLFCVSDLFFELESGKLQLRRA